MNIGNKHGIDNVRVFGSVARSEDGQKSELDLLVEIKRGRSLFDLIHFKHEVEDLLCVNVDVFT
ncbi:nucleotidyltransferase family protein [Oceanobacillus caeni]|uniref:nucleotidyltransferase family protein n=1 Tax=Virgibacillus sp. SK37 TaxID=403957 RepID=UPI00352F04CF